MWRLSNAMSVYYTKRHLNIQISAISAINSFKHWLYHMSLNYPLISVLLKLFRVFVVQRIKPGSNCPPIIQKTACIKIRRRVTARSLLRMPYGNVSKEKAWQAAFKPRILRRLVFADCLLYDVWTVWSRLYSRSNLYADSFVWCKSSVTPAFTSYTTLIYFKNKFCQWSAQGPQAHKESKRTSVKWTHFTRVNACREAYLYIRQEASERFFASDGFQVSFSPIRISPLPA